MECSFKSPNNLGYEKNQSRFNILFEQYADIQKKFYYSF